MLDRKSNRPRLVTASTHIMRHIYRYVKLLVLSMLVLYFCFSNIASVVYKSSEQSRWSEKRLIDFMNSKNNRAYFADLFSKGGFRSGMEVGVADGRFSEHVLRRSNSLPIVWYMVEPFPNAALQRRFAISKAGTANFHNGSWSSEGVGPNAHKVFFKQLSTDERLLNEIADESIDFIYLDGAHDYENVKKELAPYYSKVRKGGLLAGHDYCNYGEQSLVCNGCDSVPRCGEYTEYGKRHGKGRGMGVNQAGVVRAVHEWLVESEPSLALYHTTEDFTHRSLKKDGMDYELVITSTRNPSWFVIKPMS